MLEGDAAALQPLYESTGLVKVGAEEIDFGDLRSDRIRLIEAVVMPGSSIEGASMRGLKMHEHYSVNLLAMSREGHPPMTRLGSIRFKVGDVLLLQGDRARLREVMTTLGCLPLAGRGLRLRTPQRVWLPTTVFALAIIAAGLGLVPVQIAFVSAAVVLLLVGTLPMKEAYRSIEWPVIMLLGALIPIGESLQATGGTGLIAHGIVMAAGQLPIAMLVALLIITSMVLSGLIHNSPTAILMAPIAVAIANEFGVPAGAPPFLTPVGHQSNTLVMGPGGYQFGDYWRMGLPLDVLIVAVAVPMILLVWVP